MNEEDRLIEKYGRNTGMKVPDGYFESVYDEISAKLPEYNHTRRFVEMTFWQRVKPYVYLAAMFAGIWLMMKVFYISSQMGDMSLDNPPEQIVLAMSDASMSEEFATPVSAPDFELEEAVIRDYSDIDDFERDFGYKIDARYDKLKLD